MGIKTTIILFLLNSWLPVEYHQGDECRPKRDVGCPIYTICYDLGNDRMVVSVLWASAEKQAIERAIHIEV